MATCGVGGALTRAGFRFARNTPATFDVFYRLQVTNYGVLYVLFDSAPGGSNYIDIWDLSLHLQNGLTNYFVATFLTTSPGQSKPKRCFIACVT